jgi:hypothetical protein
MLIKYKRDFFGGGAKKGANKSRQAAKKNRDHFRRGVEMASVCRLWRRGGERRRSKLKKRNQRRKFLFFQVAFNIKTSVAS